MLYEGIMRQITAHEVIKRMEEVDRAALIHDFAYQTLCRICEILEDKTLDDPECFYRIEKIISVFNAIGCGTSRHDF